MRAATYLATDPRVQLRGFIAKMREAAPFGPVGWEDPMWDLTDRLTRAGKRLHIATRDVLWFTELQTTAARVPFKNYFDSFAKAVICFRHVRASQTVGTHRVSLRALRYLDEELRGIGLLDLTQLQQQHFRLAEAAAARREKASSAYRVAQRLEEIAAIIDQHSIANVRIQYKAMIRKSGLDPIWWTPR